MRRMWDYLKELGWFFLAGLLSLGGGVTCLVTGFVLTRSEQEQKLFLSYRQFSDRVGMLLIFGLALLFLGAVAMFMSWRSR